MTAAAPIRVAAPDGTPIGVVVSGAGRPLVALHGTTADHTTWRAVLPLLAPHATVYAVDRRGRGASGDGPGYSLAREQADAALPDARIGELPGQGHLAHLAAPADFAARVLDFLRD